MTSPTSQASGSFSRTARQNLGGTAYAASSRQPDAPRSNQ
jgi:hypothetical protein